MPGIEFSGVEQRVLASIPDFVLIIDRELRIRYLNRAQPDFQIDEFLGRSILDTTPPDEQDRMQAIYLEIFQTGQLKRFEVRGPVANNRIGHYGVTAGPYLTQGETEENFSCLILLSRDITDLSMSGSEPSDRLLYLQTILNTAADGILTIDEKGIIYDFNAAAQRIFGYNAREMIGRSINLLIPPEHAAQHDGYINNYLRTGRSNIVNAGREVTARRRDGSIFPVYLSVGEARLADGRRMFTGIVHDISARKALARMLDQSKKRYRSLYERTPVMAHSLDPEGRILSVTDTWLERLGYDRPDVIGRHIGDFVAPEARDRVAGDLDRLKTQKALKEVETRFLTRSGETLEIELSAILEEGDEITPLSFVVLNDVTEKKKSGQALQGALARAELANQAKTEFLASMSHDIRTPLNAVVGLSRILLERMDELQLPPDVREFLDQINSSGLGLTALLGDILEMSRIEYGSLPLNTEVFPVSELIAALVDIGRHQATARGVELRETIADDTPAYIETDRAKLMKVIGNIIANAIKFSPDGEVVELHAHRTPDGRLAFAVADRGPGFPMERKQELFQAFHQGGLHREQGVGLGLAIAHKLVELLGGEIQVASEPNRGARFTVFLPAGVVAPPPRPPSGPGPLKTYPGRSVLVVDDDPINRGVMRAALERHGVDVYLEETGEAALAFCANPDRKLDLVLMDLRLPGIDGVDAAHRILRERPQLPIAIITADVFSEHREQARASGLADFLTKPLDLVQLQELLERTLHAS